MKGSHNFSILQGKDKYCWVSGAAGVPLERHHCLHGTGMRAIADRLGLWVYLTPEWHRGTDGVHGKNGHVLDLRLKQECQMAYEALYGHDKWMKEIGRNYLDD